MFHCHVCGFNEAEEAFVDEVFNLNGVHVLVEHIPAIVCDRCGEKTFSRETTERVRQLVQGDVEPVRAIPLHVFEFA